MEFAKLFETEDMGQILVMLDISEPCVRYTVQPPGLGPCSIGVGFPDDDEGEAKARALFEGMDIEGARRGAEAILKTIAEAGG